MPSSRKYTAALLLILWLLDLNFRMSTAADESGHEKFFESRIRPVLATYCFDCHGSEKQESGLRLDSRDEILRGGDSGPAADLQMPAESLLIQVVKHVGEIQMPPDKKLPDSQIRDLLTWINSGLYWPKSSRSTPSQRDGLNGSQHWAFQPVRNVRVPVESATSNTTAAIDWFLLRQLRDRRLAFALTAEPEILVRRASLNLTGLPPTAEEAAQFCMEWHEDPDVAWDSLVTRLLASEHYGEHQARGWLDVARYADNKGYVFFEQKEFPWAWTYRDWVISAFNNDLPYDQFIMKQIAADLMADEDPGSLAALGFLTLGPRFMNNTHDVIDDRIDVVSRGLLGLTVSCARCHNHKFDPIPQEDYYSLYGVFRSSREPMLRPLLGPEPDTKQYLTFKAGLDERVEKLRSFIEAQRVQMMDGARRRSAEYLLAAHKKRHHPSTEDFMLLTEKGAIVPAMLHRWEHYLKAARKRRDPVWDIWFAYSDLPERDFPNAAITVLADLKKRSETERSNSLVTSAVGKTPPNSMSDVAAAYGRLFAGIDAEWKQRSAKDPMLRSFSDPEKEQLRNVLYGEGSPPTIPVDLGWGFLDLLPDRPTQAEYRKLLGEVEKYSRDAPGAPPRGM